ncbi:hypothetical protein ACQ4PT_049576 [Festuca glaucescens]
MRSASSSTTNVLRCRSPFIPTIPCPDCGRLVSRSASGTAEHDGWVYYKCKKHGHGCKFWHWELEYVGYIVENDVLVGDSAVDAIGWAEDRREALELIKAENEAMGEGPAARVQRQHDQKMHEVVKNSQTLLDAVKKVQLLLMIIACILSVMLAMTVMKKE